MRSLAVCAVAALSVAACTTTTSYVAAPRPGGLGYAERPIENDRFRVSFRAASGATPQLAQDLALRRAAELTLERGFQWFTVTDRSVEATEPTTPRIGLGVGGGGVDYGRRSAVGVGVSTGFGFGGEPAPMASLEVVFGRGAKPDDPNAYDAQSVVASLPPGPPPRRRR